MENQNLTVEATKEIKKLSLFLHVSLVCSVVLLIVSVAFMVHMMINQPNAPAYKVESLNVPAVNETQEFSSVKYNVGHIVYKFSSDGKYIDFTDGSNSLKFDKVLYRDELGGYEWQYYLAGNMFIEANTENIVLVDIRQDGILITNFESNHIKSIDGKVWINCLSKVDIAKDLTVNIKYANKEIVTTFALSDIKNYEAKV